VILGDPRHKVDSKLIIVDTEAEDFVSGVVVVVLTPGVPNQTKIILVLYEICVTRNTRSSSTLQMKADRITTG
jgi:hypothetical protein